MGDVSAADLNVVVVGGTCCGSGEETQVTFVRVTACGSCSVQEV
jgi:hypothetical protein